MSASVKRLVFGFVAALMLCAGSAFAADEGPSWKYVEGGYLSIDTDDLSASGDNYFLGAAFGGSWWHVIGYFSNGDLGPGAQLQLWRVGLGWHGLLGDKADVVGEAYYVDQSVDTSGSSPSDTGYRITGGVRWVPIKLFELDGFVNYNDVSSSSEVSYEARAILNVWRLGFGAAYEKFDDADQWNGFVRFTFGR